MKEGGIETSRVVNTS